MLGYDACIVHLVIVFENCCEEFAIVKLSIQILDATDTSDNLLRVLYPNVLSTVTVSLLYWTAPFDKQKQQAGELSVK